MDRWGGVCRHRRSGSWNSDVLLGTSYLRHLPLGVSKRTACVGSLLWPVASARDVILMIVKLYLLRCLCFTAITIRCEFLNVVYDLVYNSLFEA